MKHVDRACGVTTSRRNSSQSPDATYTLQNHHVVTKYTPDDLVNIALASATGNASKNLRIRWEKFAKSGINVPLPTWPTRN